MSLWLYGTLEGVGSARLLDQLCKSDAAYRWLCGGVSVNYHTLSDFRSEAGPVLDQLLSRSMVGLIASGLVDVQTVAVDGLRVPASARSGSFRSGERLAELYAAAKEAVEQLRAEVEDDPGSRTAHQGASAGGGGGSSAAARGGASGACRGRRSARGSRP